jgi:hypothetical protein
LEEFMAVFTDTLAAQVAAAIPKVVGALVVLIVGYFVAKLVLRLVDGGLKRAGLDRTVKSSPAGNMIGRVTKSPSRLLGDIAYWLVFLGAISLAVSMLGISALTAMVGAIYAYLPNVIAALLILLVASAISAGLSTLVARLMGETTTGKLVASITPGVVMGIAIFMALNQLQIAPAIVTITYAAILGSVALGAALAFGLGGREVASRLLDNAYETGRAHADEVRSDFALARDRAASMTQSVRDRATSNQPAEAQTNMAPAFGESLESFRPPADQAKDTDTDMP